ncbi:extracellular solute-binding protein [Actinoplanes regularis]|uniref:Carbohydrate ABC transporter substrate-binding protein, CUT1 family n=1 Tax=Actinoplanes regularis TaxID=52697 RepID=A0A239GP36_9ACTN|nr:extracellular solute-binding protein [Actinoplanes regularis]GIE90673.1 sugar ABC transporter substrate-binding protein [Actinoplanes regularis]GLW34184.1 sugar ABC transporter substrate-binding protein [Actinoplanes regularis]SNS69844.1 carbohydrate ABC transporter substrate-binding protein, CUT1 family [Actinoplanes regularis]
MKRRNFLSLSAGAAAATGLAACGSSGPADTSKDSAGGDAASYWFLSGPPGEPIRQGAVDRFNKANAANQIKVTTFQNDTYKDKLKTALGAGQAPSMIWGWGGGGLKSYVDAGQVDDLTAWFGQNAAVKDRLFKSSFGPATIDGKIYAMPCETVQPIIMLYNKEAFEKAGVQNPPQSWAELMSLVPKFNEKGIAPFSLAGQSRWTNMMWLEFLFDRIGGPEVFNAAYAGQKDAWSNPAAIDGLTKIQELINAKGFVKGFSSVTADSNADQALLYRGKAAMMLHGSWSYGIIKADGGNFIKDGKLGFFNFPAVDGGKGDPTNTVGNAGQYLSIYSKASEHQKETAKKFFASLLDDTEQQGWIESGGVPIIQGSNSKLAASPDKDFLNAIYDIASKAGNFAQSWDQALSPTAAEALLDNISKLFQLQISPKQFADNMNQVIGK